MKVEHTHTINIYWSHFEQDPDFVQKRIRDEGRQWAKDSGFENEEINITLDENNSDDYNLTVRFSIFEEKGNCCKHCGDEIRIAIFKGGNWCSENCRKVLTGGK